MADTATLQLRVDSLEAKVAAIELENLAKSGKQAEKSVTGVGNAAKRAKAPLNQVGDSAKVAAKRMSLMRNRAQQVGFQVQDMAVQIQGGTSAFVAFGQQGSQLAGAFGPGGAIIGAFIALGSIAGGFLFNSLMKASKAMETLDADIESTAVGLHKLTEETKAYKLSSSQITSTALNKTLTALNSELVDAERGLAKLESGTKKTAGRRVIKFTASPKELAAARHEVNRIAAAQDVVNFKLKAEVKLRKDIADGTSRQLEAEQKRTRLAFQRAAEAGSSPASQAIKEFEARKVVIDKAEKDRVASELDVSLARENNARVLQEQLTSIEKSGIDSRAKLESASFNAQVGAAGQIAGNLAAIAKAGGEKQFDNYKAFASAQAAISAGLAITGVLAQSAILGPAAIPLSVTIGALAAVQIGAIQSQQYQPRALGGQMKSGGSFLVGERGPELVTMGNRNANIQSAGSFGGQNTVQVTNVYQISTGVAETVQAEIFRLAPTIAKMSAAEYNRQVRQGGTTSRIMGAR